MKKFARLVMIIAGLAIPALIGVAGCDKSDGSVDPLGDAIGATSGAEEFGAPAGPLASLTVDQVDARVHLSETQRAQMRDALGGLRRAQQARGDHRGRDRREIAAGDPPMVLFIEQVSMILSPDQFRDLALLAKERKDAWIAGHGPGGPDRNGPRPGLEGLGRLAAARLGLTDEQRDQLKPIFRGHADQIRAIRDEGRNGTITREAALDRIRAIRVTTRDEVKAVLTPDQWQKAESFRRDRMTERIDERATRLDEHLARRSEFLARVLGLDPGQAQQVRTLVVGTAPARREVLSQLRAGTIEPENAAGRVAAIEETLSGQITALLTPEQKARWDAIRDLVPMRGR